MGGSYVFVHIRVGAYPLWCVIEDVCAYACVCVCVSAFVYVCVNVCMGVSVPIYIYILYIWNLCGLGSYFPVCLMIIRFYI